MEEENLDNPTVFTIKHSELKGITQCQFHAWVNLSENEVKCIKCPTVLIVNNINDYLNG